MILAKFYEKHLKNDKNFDKFLSDLLKATLPDNFEYYKYKKDLIRYLFYDDKTFLYTLKYDIFNMINSDYIEKVVLKFQEVNEKLVEYLWKTNDKANVKVLSILGNKKLEIIFTMFMPSFKSLENDVKNGEIIQNILNSILENMQTLQKNQNMMLANISHEMRTPLNSVIGYLDILETNSNLDNKAREYLTFAKNSSKILLTLINDLLDTQKLSMAKLDMVNNAFWVNKVLKNAVSISLVSATQKNIKFIYHDKLNIFYEVVGDKNRFLQILNNLFNNAVKFTPENGKVEVYATSEEKEESVKVKVTIKDTGIGISKEKQKELFKPFSRATNKEKGTGLGLYISKQLAQKMGGDIWFESEEGKGTTFYLEVVFNKNKSFYNKNILKNRKIAVLTDEETIYCKNLKQQIEQNSGKLKLFEDKNRFMQFVMFNQNIDIVIIVYPNKIEKDDLDKSFITTFRNVSDKKCYFIAVVTNNHYPKNSNVFDRIINAPLNLLDIIETLSEKIVTKSYKYLIIDDEPLNRKVMSSLILTIDKNGIIDTASDGEEGIEKLKQNKYDIVFLDKRMPKMSGYEVLEKIRELEIETKIYFLTADGDNETIQKVKEYNVEYLAKPISMNTIKNILSNLEVIS